MLCIKYALQLLSKLSTFSFKVSFSKEEFRTPNARNKMISIFILSRFFSHSTYLYNYDNKLYGTDVNFF